LGPLEIFGLTEISQNLTQRTTTVTCVSTEARLFFISREDFIKSVNLYKFSDVVLQERFIKEHLYLRRLHETEEFIKNQNPKVTIVP
jgi:hypothetical protein